MSDVPAGKMRLFTLVRPTWRPGTHTLSLVQLVGEPGDPTPLVDTAPGAQRDFVFEVTGPRTTLPPEEVLGCFPAPAAQEASDTCLPHVVLRRRTLPWERALATASADPADKVPPDTPWLALLLLPAASAALEAAPLSAALSPQKLDALKLDGAQVCDQVVAPRGVLRAAMPRRADLALLAHARQLSLTDREARDDDDGFLAVVTANRMPAPNQEHLACLVSLEGRWDDDIWPPTPPLKPAAAAAGGAESAALGDAASLVNVDPPKPGPEPTPPPLPPYTELLPVRLVVLHAWRFRAGEGGDFEATMQKIGAAGVQRFAAATGHQGGFVTLERATRDGAADAALYRGPLTPVALARDPGIATSADGALEEDAAGTVVSHAAAFELGRLLTLSSDAAMGALQEWRAAAQTVHASAFLLEDRFKPLAKKLLPVLPPNAEEIWTEMWQGAPALDQKRVQAFAGDPSGIAHLMETVPGLTWSVLAQHKAGLLAADFTSARSIAAHAALGVAPPAGGAFDFPAIDLGSLPMLDPGLGAALEVGYHELVNLASAAEAP
jgi:hypothetical protein